MESKDPHKYFKKVHSRFSGKEIRERGEVHKDNYPGYSMR